MAAIYSESALTDDATASLEALKGERYIATKEFNVLPDQDAEFEKEWATRATALAPLEGFRFFSLFKRLGPAGESGESNYLSMTVWENKNAFEAFGADGEEESIAGVAGKPVTASYEGLIPEVGASFTTEKIGESDEEDQITSEIFAGMNRFSIKAGKETEFEQKWATRDAQMSIIPGFVSFHLLRREAPEANDGNNCSVISI